MGGVLCMHPELSWRHCSGSPPEVCQKTSLDGEDNYCVKVVVSQWCCSPQTLLRKIRDASSSAMTA